MPNLGNRNVNMKSRNYSDFRDGGLNFSAGERFLTEKEIVDGKNWCYERNSGRLRTLEPLTQMTQAAGEVVSLFSSLNYGLFYVTQTASSGTITRSLYRITSMSPFTSVFIGTLSGTDTPVFCDWGEDSEKKLFVASGSVIQCYNGSTFVTQTPVPVLTSEPTGDKKNAANDAIVRDGRLLLVRKGRDTLYWSGVGDPENWQTEDDGTSDIWTESDAVFNEVGYKEGGDIVKILPIARDLAVFRSDGSLYRLFGSYPDWSVIKVGSQCEPVNRDCVAGMQNDIMFLDKDRGMRKVSTIADNDTDLSVIEKEGVKVNSWLAAHFTTDAKMWVLPDRGEIWVRPNAGNVVLVWNERYKGWAKIDLSAEITAAAEHSGVVYVAIGTNIYSLDDTSASPTIKPNMEIQFAPQFGEDCIMADFCELDADIDSGASATVYIGTDTFTTTADKTVKHQVHVLQDKMAVKLTTTGGTVVLDSLKIRSAEVV